MYESFLHICIANIFYYVIFSLLMKHFDEYKNKLTSIYPFFSFIATKFLSYCVTILNIIKYSFFLLELSHFYHQVHRPHVNGFGKWHKVEERFLKTNSISSGFIIKTPSDLLSKSICPINILLSSLGYSVAQVKLIKTL